MQIPDKPKRDTDMIKGKQTSSESTSTLDDWKQKVVSERSKEATAKAQAKAHRARAGSNIVYPFIL